MPTFNDQEWWVKFACDWTMCAYDDKPSLEDYKLLTDINASIHNLMKVCKIGLYKQTNEL